MAYIDKALAEQLRATWRPSPTLTVHRCPDCGAPMAWELSDWVTDTDSGKRVWAYPHCKTCRNDSTKDRN